MQEMNYFIDMKFFRFTIYVIYIQYKHFNIKYRIEKLTTLNI